MEQVNQAYRDDMLAAPEFITSVSKPEEQMNTYEIIKSMDRRLGNMT